MINKKDKFLKADDLEVIFAHTHLAKILQGEVGAFPITYIFLNHFINELENTQTLIKPQIKPHTVGFQNIPYYLKRVVFYAKQMLKKNEKNSLDVLLISRDRFPVIKTETGDIKSDYIFYSVIQCFHKYYKNYKIGLMIIGTTNIPPNDININNIYSEDQYLNPVSFLKSIVFATKRTLAWKYYKNNVLKYLQENNFGSIIPIINSFFGFKKLLFYSMKSYSIQNALNNLKPKVVVSNDDVMYLKPDFSSGKNIFIAVQSGNIYEKSEYCRNAAIQIFGWGKIAPDYYITSGFYCKKQKNGAAKKVIVTGLPRYDIFYHADKIYSKERFKNIYSIAENKKIILWTTHFCHGMDDNEIRKSLDIIFKTSREISEAVLVIKQHPGEGEEHTNMINEYLNKYNIDAIMASKDSDTYELLFVCDLMITKSSATAMEAVALDKPVVILNLSGDSDIVDYVGQGVALGVYKEDDLRPAVMKLLKDDTELAENREKYVERYLYKVDGNATERVVELISKMIEKTNGSKRKEYRNKSERRIL